MSEEANDTGNVTRQSTRGWAQSCDYDPEKLFNKLFHDDIEYLLSMSNLWKTRTPPKPVKFTDAQTAAAAAAEEQPGTSGGDSPANQNNSDSTNASLRDQRVLSLAECADALGSSLRGLRDQFKALSEGDHLVWDKDDRHGMDFVSACANIRANVFHIPQKSRFEIKSMAGNIIPAIATTNAITAGMVVLHAFKVLRELFEQCPNVYMRLRPNARNQIITADKFLNPPNPKCIVCSAKPEVTLRVDTERLTIKELRDEVLIKAMNMIDPDVLIDGTGTIVLSSEEGETECNNGKSLAEMAIVDGAVLRVDDFHQNYELTVIIVHKKAEYDQSLFEVIADPSQLAPEAAAAAAAKVENGKEEEKEQEKNGKEQEKNEEKEDNQDESAAKALKISEQDTEENYDDDEFCVILDEDEEEEGETLAENLSMSTSPSKTATKRKSTERPSEPPPPTKKSKLPVILESASSSSSSSAALATVDDVICIDDDDN